jgi:hypothetical protein
LTVTPSGNRPRCPSTFSCATHISTITSLAGREPGNAEEAHPVHDQWL